MYRGFCGCKWSYSLPLSCHITFHVLLKGKLVVSHVSFPCSAACLLAAVCLAAPYPLVGFPSFLPVDPKLS